MTRSDDFLDDFSRRWLEAWNSHDTDQVVALVSPDVRWDDRTFWPDVIHGTDELRRYVEEIWRAMPDVVFTEIQRFFAPDADRAVVLFRQTGHAPRQLGSEHTFDSHGCDVFLEFDDEGRLSHYLGSYDIAGMLIQMGALPAKSGRLGGAYLVSLARSGR